MNDFAERDPLEDLLRPPSARPSPELRQTVLRRTLGVLRGRVWATRLVTVAALAACYLAGAATLHLWQPPHGNPELPGSSPKSTPMVLEQPVTLLEDQAILNPEQRHELFRQAGQRYLQEQQDIQAALRCYGHSLDSGGDKDLVVTPEDDWLLIALKHARQEEKRYVRND